MNWNEYNAKFEDILKGRNTSAPYDNPAYLEYVKLNNSRSNRWLKKAELTDKTKEAIDNIKSPQKWYLITEPWCGDAAHLTPFIQKMAEHGEKIELEVIHRDGDNNMIDSYLTNGGRAIPKLIARDEQDNDLFIWGPRPSEPQALVMELKNSTKTFEEQKAELQIWYNKDKGDSIQKELTELIKGAD